MTDNRADRRHLLCKRQIQRMTRLYVVLRPSMDDIPRAKRSHHGELVEHAWQIWHDPGGKSEIIREAANVKIARRPGALFCIESIYLAHATVDVQKQNLLRRANRLHALSGTHVERSETIEKPSNQADTTNPHQLPAC
jgi:hypothetical protein